MRAGHNEGLRSNFSQTPAPVAVKDRSQPLRDIRSLCSIQLCADMKGGDPIFAAVGTNGRFGAERPDRLDLKI